MSFRFLERSEPMNHAVNLATVFLTVSYEFLCAWIPTIVRRLQSFHYWN